jgi:hypothetical protein
MHLVPVPDEFKSVRVQKTTDRGAQKVRVRHGRYAITVWLSPREAIRVDRVTGKDVLPAEGAAKLRLAVQQDEDFRRESARFR